jgi:hypothetical protein
MIMRALSPTGDWTFGAGLNNYNADEKAIEENILTWLQSWVGNCFFSLKDGIDWTNLLDVGQATNLTNSLKANILQCYGVVAVNSLFVNFDTNARKFTLTAAIQTIFSKSFQVQLSQIAGVTPS